MRGLRKQESKKFENFFAIVQKTATEQGCIFFLDAGEGRDFENNTMEGEDLSGWLIPKEKSQEFEPLWMKNNVDDDWSDMFGYAIWSNPEKPTIKFEI